MYLSRRVHLFHKNDPEGKIFEFYTSEQERREKGNGWVEDRNLLKEPKVETKTMIETHFEKPKHEKLKRKWIKRNK